MSKGKSGRCAEYPKTSGRLCSWCASSRPNRSRPLRLNGTRRTPLSRGFREAGELGMGGIYAREELGGSGLTHADAVVIFGELAKGDTTIAAYISIHNMVTWMLNSFVTDTQRAELMPRLSTMEALGSYCLTKPGAGSDAAALSTRAVRNGTDYVIDGVKQFISGAGASACYIVMARAADTGNNGISAIVVPEGTPGLTCGRLEKGGLARATEAPGLLRQGSSAGG